MIVIVTPPNHITEFTAIPTNGIAPQIVQFTDTSTPSLSYPNATHTNEWVWGDNAPNGTGANPTHTYQNAGQYTVTLITTWSDGPYGPGMTDSVFHSNYISIDAAPPAPTPEPSPVPAPAPEPAPSPSGGGAGASPLEETNAVNRAKGAYEYPLTILTDNQYADIPNKDMQSQYPLALYDNGWYPQRTVSVFPVPNQSCVITAWLWEPLIATTDLDAIINLPPGYERALRFNLAVELAAEFGKEPRPSTLNIAAESFAKIKRMNTTTQIMNTSFLYGGYDYRTDTIGRPWR